MELDAAAGNSGGNGSAWAWLGDMEMDDVLLGLGAAGAFGTILGDRAAPPVAVGFLVNAAHCVEEVPEADAGGQRSMQASDMYREKRAFLDAFFGGRFFSVLDRYPCAGRGRGWAGELTGRALNQSLPEACGVRDEMADWMARLAEARPKVLHLLISGPLMGRGHELCAGLTQRILAPPEGEPPSGGPAGVGPLLGPGATERLVIWLYAGSFNLAHSSEEDRQSLRRLVEAHAPRVSLVETTLKAGAWVCDPPQPFWGEACPTAWTLDAAKKSPVGFNASTDLQSVNMFFEEYSSKPGRGLRFLFEEIAREAKGEARTVAKAATDPPPSKDTGSLVKKLLDELEVRSLVTNLTKMVPPQSSSMEKVREALPVKQADLDAAFQKAKDHLKALEEKGGSDSAARIAFVSAAQGYAELYRGTSADYLEAGTTEFFPKEKPYSGPRLDKRCILRCMAKGRLQGGPTADVLVLLALLLFLETLDTGTALQNQLIGEDSASADVEPAVDGAGSVSVCCSFFSPAGCSSMPKASTEAPVGRRNQLPLSTRALFRLEPGLVDKAAQPSVDEGSASPAAATRVFVARLSAQVKTMDAEVKRALGPLVDEAIDAVALGARKLRAAGPEPAWGKAQTLGEGVRSPLC